MGQSLPGVARRGPADPVPDCDCAASGNAEPATANTGWLDGIRTHAAHSQRVADLCRYGRRSIVRPASLGSGNGSERIAEFSDAEDWIFASPVKIGRLPYSYTGVWRELERAAKMAGIGHLGTHAFRHTYRSWLDAVGTAVAVQQKMMRHRDIRTTFNIYGDVVTDEMTTASGKVAQIAFSANGAQTERKGS